MRIVTMAIVVTLVMPDALFAQSGDMKGVNTTDHDHKARGTKRAKSDSTAGSLIHQTMGRVIKVDFVQDELTITHEPIASLDWPVMTMVFKVKDPAHDPPGHGRLPRREKAA